VIAVPVVGRRSSVVDRRSSVVGATDIRRTRTKNSVSTPRTSVASKPPACSKTARRIAQQVVVISQ
jgi:hypothetical protein